MPQRAFRHASAVTFCVQGQVGSLSLSVAYMQAHLDRACFPLFRPPLSFLYSRWLGG